MYPIELHDGEEAVEGIEGYGCKEKASPESSCIGRSLLRNCCEFPVAGNLSKACGT
jgi:hypothetical protein